jgi:prepilin-type N-terminal cleavage/methylation domain-containing protein
MREPSHTQGFTLVELSIVLVIIGILAMTLFPLLTALTKREKILKTKEEMLGIKDAIIYYYKQNLTLPSPQNVCDPYGVPASQLSLPNDAQYDDIKGSCYLYVSTNNGSPFDSLYVDGRSIGATACVIVSRGSNATFEEENQDPQDGEFTSTGSSSTFDDILIFVSQAELEAATVWMREIREDVGVLNTAARIIAENDDDGDGFVDEDPSGSPCGTQDPPGNCDGASDWTIVENQGINAIINAGIVRSSDYFVDPWGTLYIFNTTTRRFYSAGPNKTDENCGGDDICP